MESSDSQFLTYGQEDGVDLIASLLETPNSYFDLSELTGSPFSLGPLLPPPEAKEPSGLGELEDEGFEGEDKLLFVTIYLFVYPQQVHLYYLHFLSLRLF